MPTPAAFDSFQTELARLVAKFERQFKEVTDAGYSEARLRQDYLDPLFRALGWDLENDAGLVQSQREVEIESRTDIAGRAKRADYLFRTDGRDRLVCEAKKPREDLGPRHAFQAKRYAWNKNLPLALLTDFEELSVYVVGGKPRPDDDVNNGQWRRYHFKQFPLVADEIWGLLARENVAEGSIDTLLESLPKRAPTGRGAGRLRQAYLIKPDRTRALDADFLEFLDEARRELAGSLLKHNDRADLLAGTKLNEAVQSILDRLLFIRICEDRDIDTGTRLQSLVETWRRAWGHDEGRRLKQSSLLLREGESGYGTPTGETLWAAVVRHLRALDRRPPGPVPHFNGNLFKHHFSEDLNVGDDWLAGFIGQLSDDESPYLFNVIPVEILGSVYERFLGKIVRPQGRGVTIEEKPEVRKAGGVYYTPRYIVDYIVAQTVGRQLDAIADGEKTFANFERRTRALRLLDPACGSGSFLIRAFERVCEHWQRRFTGQPADRRKELCWVDPATDDVHLTVDLKRRILRDNVFGVDLDAQAVEVTQLSLYLKMLEGEDRTTLKRQRELFTDEPALLPPLEDNVKCGNSLIAFDFSLDPDELLRVNAFEWETGFRSIMRGGGFNVVIGNPPYGAYFYDEHKAYLREHFLCQSYQLDSYLLFLERSIRTLLCHNGRFGMIIPNPWLTNLMQGATRRFVCDNTRICEIAHFQYKVFPKVTVDTEIVILEKHSPEDWQVCVTIAETEAELSQGTAKKLTHNQRKWQELGGGVINIFTSLEEEALAAKLVANGLVLEEFFDINVGIKPYQVGKGVPKQTKSMVEKRPFDSESKLDHSYRAYFRGSDIGRYLIAPVEPRFISYGPWLAEPRPAARFDAPEKLLMRQTGDSLVGALDLERHLCLNNMHVLVPKNAKINPRFFLALINSRLLGWYYQTLNPEQGEALAEVKRTNVARLPVATASASAHAHIVALVDKMLTLVPKLRAETRPRERTVLQNAVESTDRKIDELVYDLYGLTPEERRLVEGEGAGDAPAA